MEDRGTIPPVTRSRKCHSAKGEGHKWREPPLSARGNKPGKVWDSSVGGTEDKRLAGRGASALLSKLDIHSK